jgi:hypothetical protein
LLPFLCNVLEAFEFLAEGRQAVEIQAVEHLAADDLELDEARLKQDLQSLRDGRPADLQRLGDLGHRFRSHAQAVDDLLIRPQWPVPFDAGTIGK